MEILNVLTVCGMSSEFSKWMRSGCDSIKLFWNHIGVFSSLTPLSYFLLGLVFVIANEKIIH
jgi:hypothetical protein